MQEELPHELLDLVHFFSPASNCPSYPLPFRRLALFGASPPSSLLHLALSYAQGRKTPSAARRSAAHPEEHTVQRKNVLLLCTSRNKFFEGLVLENEEYLAVHGGDPAVARILEQNVEMKFFDTVARWSFFCSAVSSSDHCYQDPSEARALNLKRPPDLVIVSGLSLFLAESRNAG